MITIECDKIWKWIVEVIWGKEEEECDCKCCKNKKD